MEYSFDIIGVTPILTFFNYQQQVEQNPQRSKAYIGSYECSLDAFIKSTDMIVKKPNWDWDAVVKTIVDFWLKHPQSVQQWKTQLNSLGKDNIIVARVVNVERLRHDLEILFDS